MNHHAAIACAALALTCVVGAAELTDPTRPPMGSLAGGQPAPGPVSAAGGIGAAPERSASAPAARVAPASPAQRLAAVVMSNGVERPAALIDGQWKRPGDKVLGTAVLQSVDAEGVWVREPGGKPRRLSLFGRVVELQADDATAPDAPRGSTRRRPPDATNKPGNDAEPDGDADADADGGTPSPAPRTNPTSAGAKSPGKEQP